MTQACHIGGTWGKVGSLTTVSRMCPVRGGAQSEPGGWSDLKPLPGTPPLFTGSTTDVLGEYTW